MESVLTAFKSLSAGETTIEAKYFNKFAIELRTKMKGQQSDPQLCDLPDGRIRTFEPYRSGLASPRSL